MLLRLSERSGAGNGLPKACPDSRAATRSPNPPFFRILSLNTNSYRVKPPPVPNPQSNVCKSNTSYRKYCSSGGLNTRPVATSPPSRRAGTALHGRRQGGARAVEARLPTLPDGRGRLAPLRAQPTHRRLHSSSRSRSTAPPYKEGDGGDDGRSRGSLRHADGRLA